MQRFQAYSQDPDAGTFGFWPDDPDPGSETICLQGALLDLLQGPILQGSRVPINLSFFPRELSTHSDADTTANVYISLLDHVRIDNPNLNTLFRQ